ncbi:MAG: response regulator [Candidatus Omnitrophota bacterium]
MGNGKSGLRIAVMDDDPLILRAFSSLMRQAGYHSDFFSNAHDAYKAVTEHAGRYDLLVVDITMPDGDDGVVFAKKVRRVFPDLPIMFMTGGAEEAKRKEAQAVVRSAFLDKPFPLVEILQKNIEKFIGNG